MSSTLPLRMAQPVLLLFCFITGVLVQLYELKELYIFLRFCVKVILVTLLLFFVWNVVLGLCEEFGLPLADIFTFVGSFVRHNILPALSLSPPGTIAIDCLDPPACTTSATHSRYPRG